MLQLTEKAAEVFAVRLIIQARAAARGREKPLVAQQVHVVRDRGWGEGQLFGDILPVARAVLHGAQDLQAALVADGLQPPDERGRLAY